ncbi:MAG: NADH-quinone oxidoreductase subunit M [Thermoflavifilum sp.]|uniref:complex I subunit 4 family protein n=1 Tax=Thermoflavifilum sp. TaxID=1968839 RepID=UPI0018A64ED5|nr:NADH-quinone oxidoreductase subunit M [Thermoflavifilum sp.]QOR74979.1 MAG: NADH-quinone oxidoreductase subunit M [Thermoflavifilum sp.]
MTLTWILLILLIGGVLAWIFSGWSRWIATLAVLIDLILALQLWLTHPIMPIPQHTGMVPNWIAETQYHWIPLLGASFHLAVDGFSLLMLVLTLFIGLLCVWISWHDPVTRQNTGFFHFHLLWLIAGIAGVFMAMDLLLFYFFWELMLIPMFFLISVWGGLQRKKASLKFFLFTQFSGLFMLIAILALYLLHGQQTGQYSFDYADLLGNTVSRSVAGWLLAGFLLAFLVKLPAFPFHSWLPDAYTQSPTGGVALLAGLMSKTAAYGMLRFALPLFPEAARQFAPVMVVLGVAGILYGAKLAYAQTDLKRLIAFSSFSHMGFILLGIFSMQELAYQGVVVEMVAHAISITGLFFIAGMLQARLQTTGLDAMGGFWEYMPRMGGVTMVFVMATLGLPGLGNFIAEFLILSGTYQVHVLWAVLASLGLIASMIYALVILQRVFHGKSRQSLSQADLKPLEGLVMACLIAAIVWVGIYPQNVIRSVQPVVQQLKQVVDHRQTAVDQHLTWNGYTLLK